MSSGPAATPPCCCRRPRARVAQPQAGGAVRPTRGHMGQRPCTAQWPVLRHLRPARSGGVRGGRHHVQQQRGKAGPAEPGVGNMRAAVNAEGALGYDRCIRWACASCCKAAGGHPLDTLL
jgi:hypothetical protein